MFAVLQTDDEEGAFDAGFLPGEGGGAEDVDDGVGGDEGDGEGGGEVALEDREVEGFVFEGGVGGEGVGEVVVVVVGGLGVGWGVCCCCFCHDGYSTGGVKDGGGCLVSGEWVGDVWGCGGRAWGGGGDTLVAGTPQGAPLKDPKAHPWSGSWAAGLSHRASASEKCSRDDLV